jgi:hypothetical protein
MSIQDVTDLNKKNMELRIRQNQIAKASASSVGGRKLAPSRPLTRVTQEAIAEYNKKTNIPIEVNGKIMKYHPPTYQPDIQEVPQLDYDFDSYLGDIVSKQHQLATMKNELRKRIEQLKSEPDTRQKRVEVSNIVRDITNIDRAFNNFEREKEIIKTNKSEYDANVSAITSHNEQERKKYEEELINLNRGRINVEKQPYETEEEYVDRLTNMAEESIDPEVQIYETQMEQLQILKQNLKSLTSDEAKIENIIKIIGFKEGEINLDEIKEINKYFAGFREIYLKQIGYNNKSISDGDIASLLINYVSKIVNTGVRLIEPSFEEGQSSPLTKMEKIYAEPTIAEPPEDLIKMMQRSKQQEQEAQREEEDTDIDIIGNFLINPDTVMGGIKITNTKNKRELYLCVGKPTSKEEIILASKTGQNGTFVRMLFGEGTNGEFGRNTLIQKYMFMSSNDEMEIFGGYKQGDYYNAILHKYGSTLRSGLKQKLHKGERETIFTYGFGLKGKSSHGFVKFGKIQIDADKLHYKNSLRVRTDKGYNISGFRTVRVSDDFVKIVFDMIEGKKPKGISKLSSTEKDVFNRLIYLAGFHRDEEIGYGISDTLEKVRNRFDVLEGEINAGNDNPQVIEELCHVVHKLCNLGAVTRTEASKYIKNLIH